MAGILFRLAAMSQPNKTSAIAGILLQLAAMSQANKALVMAGILFRLVAMSQLNKASANRQLSAGMVLPIHQKTTQDSHCSTHSQVCCLRFSL